MPYSRNPRNYPPFFTTLVHSFANATDDLSFTLPERRDCNRIRIQYYSFIRALECEIPKLRKAGDIATSTSLQSLASLARTRSVEISPSLDATSWTISFLARDSHPAILSMQEQLAKQLPPPSSPSNPAIPAPFAVEPDEEYHLEGLLIGDVDEKS